MGRTGRLRRLAAETKELAAGAKLGEVIFSSFLVPHCGALTVRVWSPLALDAKAASAKCVSGQRFCCDCVLPGSSDRQPDKHTKNINVSINAALQVQPPCGATGSAGVSFWIHYGLQAFSQPPSEPLL